MRTKKSFKSLMAIIMCLSLILTTMITSVPAMAVEGVILDYIFSGDNSETAGYAQGTVTLTSGESNTYYLYWADDEKALDGYYEITALTVNANSSGSFEFGYHTAIPAGATRIIATTNKTNLTVAEAVAQFELPVSKRLSSGSGELKYTFNSYSDVHIDPDGFYKNYEEKWAQALKFAVNKKSDFIVSSGDMVNNGTEAEWDIYHRILSESDFVNPVYESDGNHDIRLGVEKGLKTFVRATGTDNTIANYDANKPYYYVKEKTTGDLFIFMALEGDYKTHTVESFSDEQLDWLTNLLEANYGTGVNIYIIEHAPINGFGAGDRMNDPLYKSHLSQEHWATVRFKSLLQKYPNLIWMSGHTHIDLAMGYNYSNENGTACHMIHNPAEVGSTWAEPDATALDYNDGYGYNSQGYFVEVYENQIVYYGANLTDEKIYPAYCYIMEGSANSEQSETNVTEEVTVATTVETIPNVKLPGSFNGWATDEMTITDGIATMTLQLDAGTYEFKIMEDDTWFGNGGIIEDTTITTSDSGWTMYTDAGNCTLKATGGTYTFNYNYSTDTLVVLYSKTVDTEPQESSETPPSSDPQESSETLPSSESQESSETLPSSESQESSETLPSSESQESSETIPSTPESEYESGDVNRDKVLDINDATCIQKALADLVVLDDEQMVLAETDHDGRVTIKDVTYIQRKLVHLEKDEISVNPVGSSDFTTFLSSAKNLLDEAYSFASYDQYQALKSLYYKYKNITSVENESEVVEAFNEKIAELNVMVEHIGYPGVYKVQDTYYFVNTLGWNEVYGYAWTNDYNKAWPGVKLEKVGTHEGYDVYGIKFRAAGEYMNIIFNNGSGAQTVDIALSSFGSNCFTVNSWDMSDGKYIAFNFQYDNAEKEPTAPTDPVGESNYMLRYYNGSAHAWDDKDTFFIPQADGTYILNFTTKNADSISCNVYNSDSAQFNCVQDSFGFDYESGVVQTLNLVSSSQRGKSISINGLSAGLELVFLYNPIDNTLSITCTSDESEIPIKSNILLRYYNSANHTWNDKDTFFTPQADGTYVLNFTTMNSESISCNVFNDETSMFNCIASSTSFDYSAGEEHSFDLVSSSSRGKSISINGLSTGVKITFVYNPTNNTLSITCG